MWKIRELPRLKFDSGLSIHKIAVSLSIARSTVTECFGRAADFRHWLVIAASAKWDFLLSDPECSPRNWLALDCGGAIVL